MLLCEANQWPADVVEYFGENGDECQMAFHFPVMPRLFMAVRREQRFPISEIMAQTPDIPDNCQWGVFLRNHDELTLEMVTDEERDYMWGEYAKDPRMKANIGIRRRLAPLLDNDINTLELFNALLLSLPGSPVLYYGDEIGMGDNIWLGDRDGVRTPMQWTPDRNGGFSTADPQRMYLPLIQDPVYGYQVTNVESQLRNTNSLLHWIRRMIQVRKPAPDLRPRHASRRSARATRRCCPSCASFGDDVVLCVNNLSRFPQPVELDLRRFEGYTPDRADRPGASSRRSASCPTCSPWPGTASTGSSCPSRPHRRPRTRTRTGRAHGSSAVADSLLDAGRRCSAAAETPAATARPGTRRRRRRSPMSALTDLLREWMPHAAVVRRQGPRVGRRQPRTASSSTRPTRCCRCTGCGSPTPTGGGETYLVPLSWRDAPGRGAGVGVRRRGPRRGRRELRLRRDARPGRHRRRG